MAILIFLVGASVANYFAMKRYSDRIAATNSRRGQSTRPLGAAGDPRKAKSPSTVGVFTK
jgi:hypothetical protein